MGSDNGYFANTGPTKLFDTVTWSRLGQGLNYTFCKDNGMLWACSRLRAWWFLARVCGYLRFSAIIINQESSPKETAAVCSPANPLHAFKKTPIHETALTLEFSPTSLTSSHTVCLMKRHPCQAAEFQLASNMQVLCIPGPHRKQPSYSPSWHTNLLHKPGMLLLF